MNTQEQQRRFFTEFSNTLANGKITPEQACSLIEKVVGTYTTTETKSTQWYNARTNAWEGAPSKKIYIFHEN